jgi:hypothetical protein
MTAPALDRMHTQLERWQVAGDRRAIFLGCYAAMTGNMLRGLENGEFNDPDWVHHLLEHFAGYYFSALSAWESEPASAPAVWQQAYQAALDPDTRALQNLILGVNAHINYDLVLAVRDVLVPEWAGLDADARRKRYRDHCQVNAVIARTVNAVQDEILEPAEPWTAWMDTLFGPVDEWVAARLITRWRAQVWRYAVEMVDLQAAAPCERLRQQVEAETLHLGGLLLGKQ